MAKKTAKKKTTKKKTTKKPASRASKPARITSAREKPRTKSEILGTIADHVGITKKEAGQVFEVMGQMIQADLKKGAAGSFTVPGMMKVVVQRKPATKAHTRPDPFNPGQTMQVKAKPARNVVKVRPMKGLKDLVA